MDTLFIHPFLPQKKLFKAYDIRGDVMLFTDDFVWAHDYQLLLLAALLASTRETVARTLRQLEAQHGLTRRDRWHCEIERTRLQALVAATPQ